MAVCCNSLAVSEASMKYAQSYGLAKCTGAFADVALRTENGTHRMRALVRAALASSYTNV